MKMKVLLLILFLCFSGLNFGAQATEQGITLTTSRPFTTTAPTPYKRFPTRPPISRFPTRPPISNDRRLRCYSGSSASKRDVFKLVTVCDRSEMCDFLKITEKGGEVHYFAGCSMYDDCQSVCEKLLRSGSVTRCSIRCCFGDLCNGRGLGLTTSRPCTRFRTTGPPLSNDRRLRCYQGLSASKRDVFKRVQVCGRDDMCVFVKSTLKGGEVEYMAGCMDGWMFAGCQTLCDESLYDVRCSIRCCFGDLCNGRGIGLTTSRPFTTRQPESTRHRVIVRKSPS